MSSKPLAEEDKAASGDPQAVTQAWGSAMVLVLITAVLLSAAVALRNRFEGERWTT
ncbi:hypothetical protein [Streptomyces sp. NPDC047706]|uniref:hypothetical protein n=1 Tax=Streptomyces sp. NPDC047706 TaxID=3365486 RepID=UPI00371764D7